jgi:hypothetical protein
MALDNARSANGRRYRTPDVYLEEITLPRPAEFRTGVPAFVGFVVGRKTHRQTADHDLSPCLLTRWEQFAQQLGRSIPGFLGYAVRGFFENGGERCVVVPLPIDDNLGTPSLREALKKPFAQGEVLEDMEDIDLVCVPDIMMESIRESQDVVFEVQQAVLEYCSRMRDRFAILDALPTCGGELTQASHLDAPGMQLLMNHRQALWSSEGALYSPWLYVAPLSAAAQQESNRVLVPPCGHVAGIYARTDARVGVHKAPANEIVEGVLDLEVDLRDEAQAELNEVGVNCLRIFPRRGIRVWGARTLSRSQNWRYVNVRRLFLTLTRWLEHNLNNLIFEPTAHLCGSGCAIASVPTVMSYFSVVQSRGGAQRKPFL